MLPLTDDLFLFADVPSAMLTAQYRMLPPISQFPNQQFYNGVIQDSFERQQSCEGLDAKDVTTLLDHQHPESGQGSKLNEGEAEFALSFVRNFLEIGLQGGRPRPEILGEIAIITPYKAQADYLSKLARQELENSVALKSLQSIPFRVVRRT